MKWIFCTVAGVICCFASLAPAATVSGGSNGVEFSGVAGIVSVTIDGPDGLNQRSGGYRVKPPMPLPDGQYLYEITAAGPAVREAEGSPALSLNNGRGSAASSARGTALRVVDSGSFRILGGAVVDGSLTEGDSK